MMIYTYPAMLKPVTIRDRLFPTADLEGKQVVVLEPDDIVPTAMQIPTAFGTLVRPAEEGGTP